MNPLDAWQATLGQLQLQMDRSAFDTWLCGAQVLAYQDGECTVGVRNEYAKDWLEQRLRPVIERTLTDIMEVPVTVTFTVWSPVSRNGGPAERRPRPRREIDLLSLLPPAPPPVNIAAPALIPVPSPSSTNGNQTARTQRAQEPTRPYAKMDMLQALALLPDLSGAATKCVVCVAAHMGAEDGDFWSEGLSLRQIAKETGYARRSSITNAMRELLDGGLVEVMPPWVKDENGEWSPAQNYHRYRATALFYRNRGNTPWYERKGSSESNGYKMYPARLQNVASSGANGANGYKMLPDSNIEEEDSITWDDSPPHSSLMATKCSHPAQMATFCSQRPDPMATKGSHSLPPPEQMATECIHSEGPEAQMAWLSAFGVKAAGHIVSLGRDDAHVLSAILDRAREVRDGVIKAEDAPRLLFATLKRGDRPDSLMQYCAQLPVETWTDLVLYAVAQIVADEAPPLPDRLKQAWQFWSPAHTGNPEYAQDAPDYLRLEGVPDHLIAGARDIIASGKFNAWLETIKGDVNETISEHD